MVLSKIGERVRSVVTNTKTVAESAREEVAKAAAASVGSGAVAAEARRLSAGDGVDGPSSERVPPYREGKEPTASNPDLSVWDPMAFLKSGAGPAPLDSAGPVDPGDSAGPLGPHPEPLGPPAPPPQDRWDPDASSLRNSVQSGEGPGEIEVGGVGTLPLHVPNSTYVHGFTEAGEPASYSTNWHLEEGDWSTVGMVRGVSEIPTTSGADFFAEMAAASVGARTRSSLAPFDYQGAVLLPDGTLGRAGEAAPELFIEHPTFVTPPNDTFTPGTSQPILPPVEKSRLVSGPTFQSEIARSDQQRRDFVGAIGSGLQLGIDLGNAAFNVRNRNYYATQTLIQQNEAGEQRAVVLATQVQQAGTLNPTGHPEVLSHFVSVGADGELQLTPVEVPTQFAPGNLETGALAPPIGSAHEDIERYGAAPYNYNVVGNVHAPRDPDTALAPDELGFTLPTSGG